MVEIEKEDEELVRLDEAGIEEGDAEAQKKNSLMNDENTSDYEESSVPMKIEKLPVPWILGEGEFKHFLR